MAHSDPLGLFIAFFFFPSFPRCHPSRVRPLQLRRKLGSLERTKAYRGLSSYNGLGRLFPPPLYLVLLLNRSCRLPSSSFLTARRGKWKLPVPPPFHLDPFPQCSLDFLPERAFLLSLLRLAHPGDSHGTAELDEPLDWPPRTDSLMAPDGPAPCTTFPLFLTHSFNI